MAGDMDHSSCLHLLRQTVFRSRGAYESSGVRKYRPDTFDLLRDERCLLVRHTDQQRLRLVFDRPFNEQPIDRRRWRITDRPAIEQMIGSIKERVKRQIMQKVRRNEYDRLAVLEHRFDRADQHFIQGLEMRLNVRQRHCRTRSGCVVRSETRQMKLHETKGLLQLGLRTDVLKN